MQCHAICLRLYFSFSTCLFLLYLAFPSLSINLFLLYLTLLSLSAVHLSSLCGVPVYFFLSVPCLPLSSLQYNSMFSMYFFRDFQSFPPLLSILPSPLYFSLVPPYCPPSLSPSSDVMFLASWIRIR